jgi:hypothetical protein
VLVWKNLVTVGIWFVGIAIRARFVGEFVGGTPTNVVGKIEIVLCGIATGLNRGLVARWWAAGFVGEEHQQRPGR